MFASGVTYYGMVGVSVIQWKEDMRIMGLERNAALVIKHETFMHWFQIVLSLSTKNTTNSIMIIPKCILRYAPHTS